MTTDLRLLLDEAIEDNIAEEIMNLSSKCKYVRHLTDLKTKTDVEVMAYAQKESRIVVTTEGNFNEKSFRICKHCGIIVIRTRSKHRAAPVFKAFLLSGHRKHAENSVTVINERVIRIKKHGGVIVEFPLG